MGRNSGKFQQCMISPDNFTPWKLPFLWTIRLWENPKEKIRPPPHSKIYKYFPETDTMRKQGDKFYNLKIFPLGLCGVHFISRGIVIVRFNLDEQNDYLKILIGWFQNKKGKGAWPPSNLSVH